MIAALSNSFLIKLIAEAPTLTLFNRGNLSNVF